MLQTVKEYISNIPDIDFGTYYQDYIRKAQDKIIDRDVNRASKEFVTLEDSTEVLKGLNTLTEELKKL